VLGRGIRDAVVAALAARVDRPRGQVDMTGLTRILFVSK
jgi:hypothetical protein